MIWRYPVRTEEQIMNLILETAKKDARIRVVGMNGSRVNDRIKQDKFQDYDIVFLVTDMKSFLQDPSWIDRFGERTILQMPEAMSLYPPELGTWFTYLMQFEDRTRIDLMLIPIEELDKYLKNDTLTKILVDKDKRIHEFPKPTDKMYWVQKPSAEYFGDCCNELWWLSLYVAKGICREELLYAVDHLMILRQELLRMLSWQIGIQTDFSVSIGKNYKCIEQYITKKQWEELVSTYRMDSYEHCWNALFILLDMFREASGNVAKSFGFSYLDEEDQKVTKYLKQLRQENRLKEEIH